MNKEHIDFQISFCLALLRQSEQSWKFVHHVVAKLNRGELDFLHELIKLQRGIVKSIQLSFDGTVLTITPADVEQEQAILRKTCELGWNVAFYSSPNYPDEWLLKCARVPPLIFYRGKLSDLHKPFCAVVGTTRPNRDAKQLTKEVSQFLVENKLNHVSGGAHGVDMIGHETVLSQGGYSCAILPLGILHYNLPPHWNDYFQTGQLQIISPWHPETKWNSHSAVVRNKLMGYISQMACLISPSHLGGSYQVGKIVLEKGLPVFVSNPKNFASVLFHQPGVYSLIENNKLNKLALQSAIKLLHHRTPDSERQINLFD